MERLTIDEMLECLGSYADHESAKQLIAMIEELKQYKDAEEQGLLLRLPCKVGGTVYCIEDKQVWCCTIEKISISKNNGTWIEISFPEEMPNIASMEFYPNEIGKTVFLTREEAEAKLKGVAMNENEAIENMTKNEAIEKLNMLNDALNEQRFDADESSGALQMAIEALEEIQQYHAIGTPEEFQALKNRLSAKKVSLRHVRKFDGFDEGECPTCGESVSRDFDGTDIFCPECGQKLDWRNEE